MSFFRQLVEAILLMTFLYFRIRQALKRAPEIFQHGVCCLQLVHDAKYSDCGMYDTVLPMDAGSTVIGIDLGGTKIHAVRYNSMWEEEQSLKVQTQASLGFEHVSDVLLEMISSLRKDSTVNIGIGVPGLVKHPDGIILQLPNIPGAHNVPLQEKLSAETGLLCTVDNDANCFALAEALLGAGKEHSVVVGITMGTGVGGGIVVQGHLLQGAHGYAGEVGHMLLMPGNPPYKTKDKRGDVEQFLSGTAMGKRCEKASGPQDYLQGDACAFMHEDIFKEAAWMCTNLIHMIDPSIIVFGGSVGNAISTHLPAIRSELSHWVLPGTPLPELVSAKLADAATRGAALLTEQQ